MTRAQRPKRVFGIDIETCWACGGAVGTIACIEDSLVIEKILTNLEQERRLGGSFPVAAVPGATAGGLARLSNNSSTPPTSGCDPDGQGRAG